VKGHPNEQDASQMECETQSLKASREAKVLLNGLDASHQFDENKTEQASHDVIETHPG
jgi:hypothetical protein